ncbi:MAG: peptidase [Dongiaceae bacterium]
MTYCVGIKVRDGLIGLADSRITSGTQLTSARKMTLHGQQGAQFFVMTSGLRSLRDKTLAYLERETAAAEPHRTMLDAVTAYAGCLRRVAAEDKSAIADANLTFDLHTLIGGQLAHDAEPALFLVYPVGNWVQVDRRTPYLAIGNPGYGRLILDRGLRYETSLQDALKLAFLAFDATRLATADVGFPLDVVTLGAADRQWREAEAETSPLGESGDWWNQRLRDVLAAMPDPGWLGKVAP